jgi:hypothetical protein
LPARPFRIFLSPEHFGPGSQDFFVLGIGFDGTFSSATGSGFLRAFALDSDWSDQALDLGSFRPGFVFVVGFKVATDDVFGDIVFLVKVEESSDFVGPLWPEPSWDDLVGKAWDFSITFFDNNGGNDAHVLVNDATPNRFSLPFTFPASSVASVSFFEKKPDPTSTENTLFHGETLFVFASGDSKDVAFELVAKVIGWEFVRDPLLVHDLGLVVIVDFDGFLLPGGGIGDIDLHF